MQIGTEEQLKVGWFGTALMIAFAAMVLIGDAILYFIYHNLLFFVLGVFLLIGGLGWVAWSLRRTPKSDHITDESQRDAESDL